MNKDLTVEPEVEGGKVQVWEDVPEELLSPDGFENGSIEDLVVPRLLLAQSTSPAVKKNNELFINGLNEGEFFNNITRKIYGPGVRIIPVLFTKNRILFDGKEITCRSENAIDGGVHSPNCASCEYSQWGTGKDNKGTACTEFRNFVCYVPEDDDFAILSFKRSMAQTGKRFYTTTNSQKRMFKINGENVPRQLPIYGCEYMIKALEKSNDDGSFYVIAVELIQDVQNRNLLKNLKAAHDRFKQVNLVVSEED